MPLLEAGGSWTGLRHPDDVRWQLRLRSNSNHLAQSWGEAPQAGKPRGGGKEANHERRNLASVTTLPSNHSLPIPEDEGMPGILLFDGLII